MLKDHNHLKRQMIYVIKLVKRNLKKKEKRSRSLGDMKLALDIKNIVE